MNQPASGTFFGNGSDGVTGEDLDIVSPTDLIVCFLLEPLLPGQELQLPTLSLSDGDKVTISFPQPMQFDASVLLFPAGPGSYTAKLFGIQSEVGPPTVIATNMVTFGQAPTPVPLPAPALLFLCAAAALGVRRKA